MIKIDYKKTLKTLYHPGAWHVTEVDVPPLHYLMIDGQGDPETSADYHAAIEALFSVSYTLKFMLKKGVPGIDYTVMPLESLWWAHDMSDFTAGNRDNWQWTAMIMQPDCICSTSVAEAISQVEKKKQLAALPQLRFECFQEGPAAQILHIGPFSEEGPTIQKIHDHIASLGGTLSGKHHEIYLSDFRKTAPEKLKTVIRQPYRL